MQDLANEHAERAARLDRRVVELDAAVPAAKNAELVAQLRRTQVELIEQLTALKGEGGLDPLQPPQLPASVDEAAAGEEPAGLIELAKRENEELRFQLEKLNKKLKKLQEEGVKSGSRPPSAERPSSGLPRDVQMLRLQIKELESYQSQLERERSELKRRAMMAEEQLKQMQQYVDANLGKYQAEIVRLKEQLAGR